MISERIVIDSNGLFVCPYCNQKYRALAYHTTQTHGITARRLRYDFGLPFNFPLQTKDLVDVRRDNALKNNMDEQLRRVGQRTRFKKGRKLSQTMIIKISRGHSKSLRKVKR